MVIGVGDFLKSNNEILNILIGVVSIGVSVCGVYFGRKAYYVAKEIFDKGLSLDKKKVLQQVSLEFVTDFFIPFSRFKTATRSLLDSPCDMQNVLHVRDLIKDNTFFVQFPYFDVHKGDIWDSLENCKDMSQSEAFNMIMDFVEKARSFDRINADLYERLDKYLDSDNLAGKQERAVSTLKDFFETCQSVNQDMFNKGMKMIDELMQYEYKLPKELNISEMKRQLFRD